MYHFEKKKMYLFEINHHHRNIQIIELQKKY